jgi:hypothetical protein
MAFTKTVEMGSRVQILRDPAKKVRTYRYELNFTVDVVNEDSIV